MAELQNYWIGSLDDCDVYSPAIRCMGCGKIFIGEEREGAIRFLDWVIEEMKNGLFTWCLLCSDCQYSGNG